MSAKVHTCREEREKKGRGVSCFSLKNVPLVGRVMACSCVDPGHGASNSSVFSSMLLTSKKCAAHRLVFKLPPTSALKVRPKEV